MNVSIKSLKQVNKEVVVLTCIGVTVNSLNKNILETQLEDYAHHNLFPGTPINVYRSVENDTASITAIKDLNSFDENSITLS